VPRDVGTGWDFDDVRDHYLELLFGVDPVALRSYDHHRYLELSRAVSGEVMAEVFGEWRRSGSPCGGGILLWLRDLQAGAGWGVLDHTGAPKVAYHHLRRVLAPVAAWTTDEGLGGILAHVANDRPEPLRARLRVALYRDLEQQVDEAHEEIELGPHSALSRNVETILGHFADASWTYRFGPPAQDVVAVTLEDPGGKPLSQAFRFPAGRPLAPEPADRLGLEAAAEPLPDGSARLTVRARRLVNGLRIHAPGWTASDDAFCVEPGGEREVTLRPGQPGAVLDGAAVTALNLSGRLRVES
jgi:beta-mannosidase